MAEGAAAGGILFTGEIDARRAQQLAYRYSLGAAGDKGALGRHQGDVAEKQVLLLDFAGLLDQQLRPDIKRSRIGHVFLAALLLGVVGLAEFVVHEGERQAVAGEILNRGYFLQRLAQPLLLEPAEGISLDLN
ncbi:hypothetical protein ES703_50288 [subsurface metagenome]